MDFRNIFLAGLVATTAMVASADVTYLRGRHRVGPREEDTVVRVTFRHVPNSDPDDPFHDTYARNLGRRRDIAEKPVANIHAKISSARYDEERAEAHLLNLHDRFGIDIGRRRPPRTHVDLPEDVLRALRAR